MKAYGIRTIIIAALLNLAASTGVRAQSDASSDHLRFGGEITEKQANFTFTGSITGGEGGDVKPIYSSRTITEGHVRSEGYTQTIDLEINLVHGTIREVVFWMNGDGEVAAVNGEHVIDWSVRRNAAGQRFLVLRLDAGEEAPSRLGARIGTKLRFEKVPTEFNPLLLVPENPQLHEGLSRIRFDKELLVDVESMTGVTRVDPSDVAAFDTDSSTIVGPEPLAFRSFATIPSIELKAGWAQPDAYKVVFEQFSLRGDLLDDTGRFVLSGVARVRDPNGGELHILGGNAALTSLPKSTGFRIEHREPYVVLAGDTLSGIGARLGTTVTRLQEVNQLTDADQIQVGQRLIVPGPRPSGYVLVFDKAGEYPVMLEFDARVDSVDGWKRVWFTVAAGSLRPVELAGLSPETEFHHSGSARPERDGDVFRTNLSAVGPLNLHWKSARPEGTGRLFYSAESLAQISIRPGQMRQIHSMHLDVMQGELSSARFDLVGSGEIVRVVGDDVLEWSLVEEGDGRGLLVQFNRSIGTAVNLEIHTQSSLGGFPLSVDPMGIRPLDAIRTGGFLRVISDGAVRLEVTEASGLSQISPEQFPRWQRVSQNVQQFAYRFSDSGYDLTVQADNIVPEVSVSQVVVQHVAENETTIEASLELEIREAPVREFSLEIPEDFVITGIQNGNLSDYFLTPGTNASATLRIVFSRPVIGQEALLLRLERNRPLEPGEWTLPHIQPIDAKTVRGHVGVSADPGLRLSVVLINDDLSEVGTSFFPKRVENLQLAWRWREPSWQAVINIERLAKFVQADAVHLFSIGEGIANGSSIFNYLITGSPVSLLRFTVPTNYSNIEFTGRDVRSWKVVDGVHEVYLQSPVVGTYTLLATFDRQFERQGATLNLEGLRPEDVNAEQGYNLVVSDHPFQVEPSAVSEDLIRLESGEIPAEYLLLFEAPILDAYQYLRRPFELALQLSSFVEGETQDQVVDRAAIQTEVSGEGQVLSSVQFLLKSKGRAHLRMTVPAGVELWSSQVNSAKVIPVSDGADILVPLPQGGDPNSVITVDLKLASKSSKASDVTVALPVVAAPILQTTWTLGSESNHRLIFLGGTMSPSAGAISTTGFGWLMSAGSGPLVLVVSIFVAAGLSGVGFRWLSREDRHWSERRNLLGILLALGAVVFVFAGIVVLFESAMRSTSATGPLVFSTPFLEAGSDVVVRLRNVDSVFGGFFLLSMWPVVLGVVAWMMQIRAKEAWQRRLLVALGWAVIAFATLGAIHGGTAFLLVLSSFIVVHFLRPILLAIARLPRGDAGKPEASPAAGATALLALGVFLHPQATRAATGTDARPSSVVTSVVQDARSDGGTLFSDVVMSWMAAEGQSLEFLRFPAVLTDIAYDKERLTLLEDDGFGGAVYRLTARESGVFEIRFGYQLKHSETSGGSGFELPTAGGLVNRLNLLIVGEDVEISSRNLVSLKRESVLDNGRESTRAAIVLGPHTQADLRWKPRSRDTSAEEAVYYGEVTHLFTPSAGVVQGVHQVLVRLSRGQLGEIRLRVPDPFTITDVEATFASAWRFDPDTRILRVPFHSPMSSAFVVRVRSQIATSPLPYVQAMSLLSLEGATDQIGTVGVATGAEVQLQTASVTEMTAINLEDFEGSMLAREQSVSPDLRLRRAFRYEKVDAASIEIEAIPVEPDVRVESRSTLSLGDDRTVLAAQITADITRAGIFKLSFVLPTQLEVESLTGDALSHWTELETDGDRVVTMHLRGKTEGRQQFSLTLAGQGRIEGAQLTAPRVNFREASKQSGQLIVAPELGVRLNVNSREGVTQLDPSTLGIKQRGVQAFRLLQKDWSLVFDIEQIDPWIEVSSLQDFDVREGQVQVNTVLDYQIQNAAVNSLLVRLPMNAGSVTFTGRDITDFIETGDADGRMSTWQVKLSRRWVGAYPLKVSYRRVGISQTNDVVLSGVTASGVNLQRGFVSIRASGRLEVRVPEVPSSLVHTDWQTIPAALKRVTTTEANHAFRVIEPDFDLAAQVVRHTVAQLLPAQVERVELNSTISSNHELLTEVRMWIHPGDKRLLNLRLPAGSDFWFAFVNSESASPWIDGDRILIPLDENSDPSQPAIVEFFYTSRADDRGRGFDHVLAGPEFDLPLRNIIWTMSVSPDWSIASWDDRWQFQASRSATGSRAEVWTNTSARPGNGARSVRVRRSRSFSEAMNSSPVESNSSPARPIAARWSFRSTMRH